MNQIAWQNASACTGLVPDAVHIWRASLGAEVDFAASLLSAAERQRGDRFLQQQHRRRFRLARAFLRLILARYLPIPPAQIAFREGAHGKVYLSDDQAPLQFNLSHSGDLAVYAVTLSREIGVDIEWMDPKIAAEPLAARFFTPGECDVLAALSGHAQTRAFYQLWTRKEAYLKALGLGLSGLSQTMAGADTGAVMCFEPAPQYAGAVVLTGSPDFTATRLDCFQINPEQIVR